MEIETTRIEYIDILTKRILSLLPLNTGRTEEEVELDPQFILTKAVISDNQKRFPHTVGHLLLSFASILKRIKAQAADAALAASSAPSIDQLQALDDADSVDAYSSSTLLICKIVTSVLSLSWDRERGDSEFGEFIANYSQLHHFEIPPPLASKLFMSLIDIYVDLLSPRIVAKVLELVGPLDHDRPASPAGASRSAANHPSSATPHSFQSPQAFQSPPHTFQADSPSSRHHRSHSPSSSNHPSSPTKSSRSLPLRTPHQAAHTATDEIDKHIGHVLRYIASACPVEYFNYVYARIFRYIDLNQPIPEQALRHYAPLLRYMFYVDGTTYPSDNVNAVGNALAASGAYFTALPHITSRPWKRAFLVLLTASIQDQSFCRPMDYNLIISHKDPEFQEKCSSLFLEAFHAFDEPIVENDCSSFVLSWLVSLCLRDFNELLDVPRSTSTSRGLAYLRTILRDSRSGSNLESFSVLIELFQLGSRMLNCDLPDHLMARFTRKYVDQVHASLIKYGDLHRHFVDDASATRKFNLVVINFYTAALMIDPHKYVDVVVRMFDEGRDDLRELRLVLKVIRAVAEAQTGRHVFEQLIARVGRGLREVATTHPLVEDDDADRASTRSAGSVGLAYAATTSSRSTPSNPPDILADIFKIFIQAPELYFNDTALMSDAVLDTGFDAAVADVVAFCAQIALPISYAFKSSDQDLFSSACELAFVLVQKGTVMATQYSSLSTFANYTVSNLIVQAICEACLQLSLTTTHFKACFVLVTNFLQCRDAFKPILAVNRVLNDPRTEAHSDHGREAAHVIEKVLLLALCTHDVVFYNTAKVAMKWYCNDRAGESRSASLRDSSASLKDSSESKDSSASLKDSSERKDSPQTHQDNLVATFQRVADDTSVFTGFVSLHKTFRTILRDAHPTPSLYQVWPIIYDRWLATLSTQTLSMENLVFRHYTGFLVSTSGCFFSDQFLRDDQEERKRAHQTISNFFDKCISLLRSQDLVIRVVIKEALAKESHQAVYHLITTKMAAIVSAYTDKNMANEALFVESVLTIVTGMVAAKNDGSFLLVAILPQLARLFVEYIRLVDGSDAVKLKLRFCKLVEAIEADKSFYGIGGAFRLRNWLSKVTCEWLEGAVFDLDDANDAESAARAANVDARFRQQQHVVSTPIATNTPTIFSASMPWPVATLPESSAASSGPPPPPAGASRSVSELAYLNLDLALQASKTLAFQLSSLKLDVPEGTKDSEIPKYKDIAFGNYFSLFYKIIQKYTAQNSPAKSAAIIENILRAMSNLLQYDSDIGMQFVLLLGYHENQRIRALFINLFSSMLSSRKLHRRALSFPEKLVAELCELPVGAIADAATSTEHNLLASALFGVYGYKRKLDVLFKGLLRHEIDKITRSTEMFRRNSPLTRLLSNFATDYGKDYLVGTLGGFIDDLVRNEVVVEVERPRTTAPDSEGATAEHDAQLDTELYLVYLNMLVTAITSSAAAMPLSFKFLCAEIYDSVKAKFADAALVAVGSFLFLRFMCPAIISPEVVFKVDIANPKVKRTLMQLVKVLQNMANGSLALLKWPGLSAKMPELVLINSKITAFLREISTTVRAYPFDTFASPPMAELNYLHKFLYTYITTIKMNYIVGGSFAEAQLHRRVEDSRALDSIAQRLGSPKSSVKLQLTSPFKTTDPSATAGSTSTYNVFMAKMSMSHNEKWNDVRLVTSSIFPDGTPIIVVNFRRIKDVDYDIDYLFFRLYEITCQVWDNKFYLLYDFTEFRYTAELAARYYTALRTYTPQQLFDNCTRLYFFNIPRSHYEAITEMMKNIRLSGLFKTLDTQYHSSVEPPSVIDNLCLDSSTVGIRHDTRVVFNAVELWDPNEGAWIDVSLRMGRKWLQICSTQPVLFLGTKKLSLVDVYRLADIAKCEVVRNELVAEAAAETASGSALARHPSRAARTGDSSKPVSLPKAAYSSAGASAPPALSIPGSSSASLSTVGTQTSQAGSVRQPKPAPSGGTDQFTISLATGDKVTLRASERSEILRFLYFTTSRLKSASYDQRPLIHHSLPWFGRLYNITFQGLLSDDEGVRTASGLLFGSLSTYFSIDFGIKTSHAKNIAFPANTTEFVESVSAYLARKFPQVTYRFFKAFFDNSGKLSPTSRLVSTIYLAPWVDNIYEHIYLSSESNGPEQVAELVRQFCRLSAANKDQIAFVNDYIWKKLFAEPRIAAVLVDEVIAFAIDNKNDGPDWWFIIAVIFPSVEVCGDVVARLINCVNKTRKNDSTIAEQSNLFEIKVLVKICASLFFNSYVLARLYLADIFFLATLFIDNVYLDFGADLQRLFVNVIQSFLHKPNLTKAEHGTVDATISYFSDQRAKMLFGLTRDISGSAMYAVQLYNRAMNFEKLCDYLGDFIAALGADDDRATWTARWCSNAVEVASSEDSVFQNRAILVFGILSKKGVAEGTVSKCMKLLAQNPSNNLEYLTNGIIMTARMLEGLPCSKLHAVLIWPVFCYGLLNYTNLYQSSVLCLMNTIAKLSEGGDDFMDSAFEQRKNLEPYMSEFERSQVVQITRENFGIHVFFVLTRGLKVSHFKHNSLGYLKNYLILRSKVRVPRERPVRRLSVESGGTVETVLEFPPPKLHEFDFCAFLVFIYLSVDDASFAEYLSELNEQTDFAVEKPVDHKIPQVITEFLSNKTPQANLTLLLAAHYYTSESMDQKFKLRFLHVYLHLIQTSPESALLVLHLLLPAWQVEMVNSNNIEGIETIAQIMEKIMECDDYESKKYEDAIEAGLEKFQVHVLRREDSMSTNGSTEMKLPEFNNVNLLMVMAYRSACLHVESHELED